MTGETVLRNIGHLVTCKTCDGDPLGIVRVATLHARDGRVTYAGPESHAPPISSGATEIDARGGTVTPGFVDSHTHIAWAGSRADEYEALAGGGSYSQIAEAGGGIRNTVQATSAALRNPGTLLRATRQRLLEALRWGATTVEIKSGYGADTADELLLLDTIASLANSPGLPSVVPTYLPLHAPPGDNAAGIVEDVIQNGIRASSGRARFIDVFCDEYAWPPELCEPVLMAAQKHGMRRKLHADQLSSSRGAELAATSSATSADHLDLVSDHGIGQLARAGVIAVLTPGTSLSLGTQPAPAARLMDAGVPIAIATDRNPGTCNCSSMAMVMSLAVALYRIPPASVLLAATAGGARALDLPDRGVLAPGMRADLIIWPTRDWRDITYQMGMQPSQVLLGGRPARRNEHRQLIQ